MKQLLRNALVFFVSLCLVGAAAAKNIKVVCHNDIKHDKAKLIKAMKIARPGDKLVIIGVCQPRGVALQARKAYAPSLTRVEVITTSDPHRYRNIRFDSDVQYDRSYDVLIVPGIRTQDNFQRNQGGTVRVNNVVAPQTRPAAVAPASRSVGQPATRATTQPATRATTRPATRSAAPAAKSASKPAAAAEKKIEAKAKEEDKKDEAKDAKAEAAKATKNLKTLKLMKLKLTKNLKTPKLKKLKLTKKLKTLKMKKLKLTKKLKTLKMKRIKLTKRQKMLKKLLTKK
ncbi:hypothetical protein H0W80_05085 [Candidatus Saccharibacteria bacterium]|nr:hypothetical protein [Candidatus Saccharibacteria bacterium]